MTEIGPPCCTTCQASISGFLQVTCMLISTVLVYLMIIALPNRYSNRPDTRVCLGMTRDLLYTLVGDLYFHIYIMVTLVASLLKSNVGLYTLYWFAQWFALWYTFADTICYKYHKSYHCVLLLPRKYIVLVVMHLTLSATMGQSSFDNRPGL